LQTRSPINSSPVYDKHYTRRREIQGHAPFFGSPLATKARRRMRRGVCKGNFQLADPPTRPVKAARAAWHGISRAEADSPAKTSHLLLYPHYHEYWSHSHGRRRLCRAGGGSKVRIKTIPNKQAQAVSQQP